MSTLPFTDLEAEIYDIVKLILAADSSSASEMRVISALANVIGVVAEYKAKRDTP